MKKIFFNRKIKAPVWSQIYLVWFIFFIIALGWNYNKEVITVKKKSGATFELKKEYDKISNVYLRVINDHPNSPKYTPALLSKIKKEFHEKSWSVEKNNISEKKQNCEFITYQPQKFNSQSARLTVVFDHYGKVNDFYLMHTLADALAEKKITNVSLVSSHSHPSCMRFLSAGSRAGSPKNSKNIIEKKSDYILIYPAKIKEAQIQPSLPGQKSSSIDWSAITPSVIKRPGILTQLAFLAYPFFQRVIYTANPEMFSIAWQYPKEWLSEDTDMVRHIFPSLVFTASQFTKLNHHQMNSFWLSEQSAITDRGVFIFAFFLVILAWLPVANRLYEGESIRHITKCFFFSFLNSIFLFLILAIVKIMSALAPENSMVMGIVLAGLSALLFLLNRFQKSVFSFHLSSITEYTVFNFFASLFALGNFFFYIFLLPLISIVNKKGNLSSGVYNVFIALALVPFVYAFSHLLWMSDLNILFSPVWLENSLFFNVADTSILFLFMGSFLIITRKAD